MKIFHMAWGGCEVRKESMIITLETVLLATYTGACLWILTVLFKLRPTFILMLEAIFKAAARKADKWVTSNDASRMGIRE